MPKSHSNRLLKTLSIILFKVMPEATLFVAKKRILAYKARHGCRLTLDSRRAKR
jgi:hypothetical protein